jgi:hypothetical protein
MAKKASTKQWLVDILKDKVHFNKNKVGKGSLKGYTREKNGRNGMDL